MADAESPLHGVSLRQYATVLAGRADGIPIRDLLDYAGVEAEAWPPAEEAWGDRIVDDVEADGELGDALEAAMAEAQRGWTRRLPPLDEDLKAWLDFERAWALAADPAPLLERARMRASDIARLQALWADRMRDDRDLAARALVILTEEPDPPCAPEPEPPRLPAQTAAALSLTLQQYASLSVTLADYPDRAAHTLAAYRVTPEQKAALDAHFQARFASEPGLEQALQDACSTYRAWLSKAGRTP